MRHENASEECVFDGRRCTRVHRCFRWLSCHVGRKGTFLFSCFVFYIPSLRFIFLCTILMRMQDFQRIEIAMPAEVKDHSVQSIYDSEHGLWCSIELNLNALQVLKEEGEARGERIERVRELES